jgi:hypothetical protein
MSFRPAMRLLPPALLRAAVLGASFLAPAAPGPAPVQLQALKAAFICNFLALTRWPGARSTLVVGVYGDSPAGGEVAGAMPKAVGRLVLRTERLRRESREWPAVDAVYVPEDQQGEFPAILRRLGKEPVLIIGDSATFLEEGGHIRFLLEGDMLRFEVNLGAASKRGLQFSANLLKHARWVVR